MKHIIFAILVLFVSFAGYTQEEKVKIQAIEINGNHRLDYKTVYLYTKITVNSEVSRYDLDQVVKNLYSTQLFAKVDVQINKKRHLIINVQENPVVNKIIIQGNRAFSDKELTDNILKLKPLSIFTKAKLQNDLNNLIVFYRNSGRLAVNIDYKITELASNQIDLILKINEGYNAKIRKIKFIGNKAFSEHVLKQVISSKEYSFNKFLSRSTKYTADRLMLDQALISHFYATKGFLDFKIRSTISEVSDNYLNANLIFSIEEGPKYKFGNNNVIIDDKFHDKNMKEDLRKIIHNHQDEIFNIEQVNYYVDKITAYLNNKGSIFANVKTEYKIHDDVVDIDYVINVGNKIYVNNINIYGNSRTIDKVIRQQLSVSEGDAYNASSVQKARRNILNMGFFETVDLESQKVTDNLVNLNFNVKERSTGTFEIGAGFSSTSGLIGHVNIKERNLFGTGRELSFTIENSALLFSSSVDFTENKVFDTDVSLGLGLFYSSQDQQKDSTFSSSNTGGIIRSSYNITNDLVNSLRYTYKYSNIYNVKDNASSFIKEQKGKNVDSSIGYSLAYNKLDNYFQPKDGFLIKLSQDLSGFGGNLHYVKTEGSFVYFKSILQKINNDIVLKIKPTSGYIFAYNNEEIKIGQRFFIGNNEIRGFNLAGIGPRDIVTKDALGGKFYFTTIGQVDFPIGLPQDIGVKGSLFIDSGTLFGLDYKENKQYYNSHLLRVSAGFGFSWKSPIGPMRLDFGFPLVKEDYDVTNTVKFSIDTGI